VEDILLLYLEGIHLFIHLSLPGPAVGLGAGLLAVGSLHPCPQENLLSLITNSCSRSVLVRVAMTKYYILGGFYFSQFWRLEF